jgi:hypothetical protein
MLRAQPSIRHVTLGNIYDAGNTLHIESNNISSYLEAPLSQSTAQITSAYRNRYAAYLAATFNINLKADQSETDYQLASQHASKVSGASSGRN